MPLAKFLRRRRVWIVTTAWADDPNERGSDLAGVYSSEARAREIAAKFPHTGRVEEVHIDEVPSWL
jgi:hypothetical protein